MVYINIGLIMLIANKCAHDYAMSFSEYIGLGSVIRELLDMLNIHVLSNQLPLVMLFELLNVYASSMNVLADFCKLIFSPCSLLYTCYNLMWIYIFVPVKLYDVIERDLLYKCQKISISCTRCYHVL